MIENIIESILCLIIFFWGLIVILRIKICKININDYFYCALNNRIYMKGGMINKIKWKH